MYIRAHDIISVGTDPSQWSRPDFPEVGGPPSAPDHVKYVTKRVRIDTTYPEILDLFLFRVTEGRAELVPTLFAGNPLLDTLGLNGVLITDEGFTFLSDPELLNMYLGYGVYDPESGLRNASFSMSEASFSSDYATYQRTL